jgi:ATP-dependent helicase YprA (DUF1998 family)
VNKHFALWNLSGKKTKVSLMARLLTMLMQHGMCCIAFCKMRKLCKKVLVSICV